MPLGGSVTRSPLKLRLPSITPNWFGFVVAHILSVAAAHNYSKTIRTNSSLDSRQRYPLFAP